MSRCPACRQRLNHSFNTEEDYISASTFRAMMNDVKNTMITLRAQLMSMKHEIGNMKTHVDLDVSAKITELEEYTKLSAARQKGSSLMDVPTLSTTSAFDTTIERAKLALDRHAANTNIHAAFQNMNSLFCHSQSVKESCKLSPLFMEMLYENDTILQSDIVGHMAVSEQRDMYRLGRFIIESCNKETQRALNEIVKLAISSCNESTRQQQVLTGSSPRNKSFANEANAILSRTASMEPLHSHRVTPAILQKMEKIVRLWCGIVPNITFPKIMCRRVSDVLDCIQVMAQSLHGNPDSHEELATLLAAAEGELFVAMRAAIDQYRAESLRTSAQCVEAATTALQCALFPSESLKKAVADILSQDSVFRSTGPTTSFLHSRQSLSGGNGFEELATWKSETPSHFSRPLVAGSISPASSVGPNMATGDVSRRRNMQPDRHGRPQSLPALNEKNVAAKWAQHSKSPPSPSTAGSRPQSRALVLAVDQTKKARDFCVQADIQGPVMRQILTAFIKDCGVLLQTTLLPERVYDELSLVRCLPNVASAIANCVKHFSSRCEELQGCLNKQNAPTTRKPPPSALVNRTLAKLHKVNPDNRLRHSSISSPSDLQSTPLSKTTDSRALER